MFQIQMGYPNIIQNDLDPFKRLEDVFPSLFHGEGEAFFLLWQDIPIRFRYREELECNFASILSMLCALKEKGEGTYLVAFTNELLKMDIKMRWDDKSLHVSAYFTTEFSLYEKYVAILNENCELQLDKKMFMAEWHTLIHQVVLSFHAAKVCLENREEKERVELLHRMDQQLEGYGSLYEVLL